MIDSEQIEIKNTTKCLGLHINEHLHWNEHVHKVHSKVNSGIYALSKISFYCRQATLIKIYYAHIFILIFLLFYILKCTNKKDNLN